MRRIGRSADIDDRFSELVGVPRAFGVFARKALAAATAENET